MIYQLSIISRMWKNSQASYNINIFCVYLRINFVWLFPKHIIHNTIALHVLLMRDRNKSYSNSYKRYLLCLDLINPDLHS